MLITHIKIKGVDHKLAKSIEIDEGESWLGGKHVYIFEAKGFRILSYHDNIGVSRNTMIESLNLVINSSIFEDFSHPDWKKALKFQNFIKRYVYG